MGIPKTIQSGWFAKCMAALTIGALILTGCSAAPDSDTEDTNASAQVDQTATPISVSATVPSQATSEEGEWVILTEDPIITLEPYRMVGILPEESIASHIWDTLTWLNDELQIEPQLAESWRLVNNFTWEFKLREGVTFHNGEPLNAEAVRFSIERAATMPDSLESFAQDTMLEQVEVIDDYTIRITTGESIANLPFYLASLEILPPIYYSATDPDQLAIAPIGSGPYRLVSWSRRDGVLLEAVTDYWKGTPVWPRLNFRTVPLVEERLAALGEMSASLVTDLPPISIDRWNTPGSRLEAIESTRRMLIGMHVAEGGPLEDKRVRQALNYGVNVEQIVGDLLEGYGERYGSWVNPPANNIDLAPWVYDPDLARELLGQAGYQNGITMTLSVPINTYTQGVAIAEAVAQQLGEIGVMVEVQSTDWSSFVQRLLSDDIPDLFVLGLNSRGDGLEDVRNLSIDFAFNPTGWHNNAFEDMLERARSTVNADLRAQQLNEAQAIAYDEAPWIWLWRQYNFYGVSQDLEWTPRRDGLVNLYRPLPSTPDTQE